MDIAKELRNLKNGQRDIIEELRDIKEIMNEQLQTLSGPSQQVGDSLTLISLNLWYP